MTFDGGKYRRWILYGRAQPGDDEEGDRAGPGSAAVAGRTLSREAQPTSFAIFGPDRELGRTQDVAHVTNCKISLLRSYAWFLQFGLKRANVFLGDAGGETTMLIGIINLALLAGTGLCVLLFVHGSYQVVKLLFWNQGFRRVIARLVLHEPADLDEYAEYAE